MVYGIKKLFLAKNCTWLMRSKKVLPNKIIVFSKNSLENLKNHDILYTKGKIYPETIEKVNWKTVGRRFQFTLSKFG